MYRPKVVQTKNENVFQLRRKFQVGQIQVRFTIGTAPQKLPHPKCPPEFFVKLLNSLKKLWSEHAKSHWLHLFYFSLLCIFICVLRELGSEHAKSHWLHLFRFSRLYMFKCVLKFPVSEEAKSHWLHLFDFSPLWVFKCLLKSLA